MTTAPFEYWRPGPEERQVRVFFSHRYGKDQTLYDEVIADLSRNGFSIQDVSLSASQILTGPRGGDLPTLKVQSEIAARIYTSDILIAPSRPAVTRSRWVTWEVQLAAIGYGIPILFVNHRNDQQLSTRLIAEVSALGLPHRACRRDIEHISRSFAELVSTRPTWVMRQEESEKTIRFRGPPGAALEEVMRKLPYRPRLNNPDLPPPRPKRGLFSIFSARD
jgi:hypothetical protein